MKVKIINWPQHEGEYDLDITDNNAMFCEPGCGEHDAPVIVVHDLSKFRLGEEIIQFDGWCYRGKENSEGGHNLIHVMMEFKGGG